jgi:MoaA/NifB/PqqE/SkfB family radical SAM enzyme
MVKGSLSLLESAQQKIRIARNLLTRHNPPYLIYFVTKRCNLSCEMCFNWEDMQRESDELTLEEVEKVSRSFERLLQLTISGGEPILRADLPQIIEAFYRNSHLSLCTLTTNGFYKDKTLRIVQEILDRCPLLELRVAVSIDGLQEAHNQIRRHPLSFQRAIETFEALRSLYENHDRLALHITTVVGRSNHDKTHEIYDYVQRELKTPYHSWLYTRGNPPDPSTKNFPLESFADIVYRVETEEPRGPFFAAGPVRALMSSVRETVLRTAATDEMQLPCVAGRKIIVLTAEGDVKICELLEEKGLDPVIANIREHDYDVTKVLATERAQEMIRQVAETNCHCTWECATVANHVFNPAAYPRVLKKMFRPGADGPIVQISPSVDSAS